MPSDPRITPTEQDVKVANAFLVAHAPSKMLVLSESEFRAFRDAIADALAQARAQEREAAIVRERAAMLKGAELALADMRDDPIVRPPDTANAARIVAAWEAEQRKEPDRG